MNWLVLIFVGIAVIALIVFLIIRNQKDEKGFEQQLNEDYPKPKEEDNEEEIEKMIK